MGGRPPSCNVFRNPPTKTDAPHGASPPFKNEGPQLKNNPPPLLKRETPFHEIIPRKSTINNNLISN